MFFLSFYFSLFVRYFLCVWEVGIGCWAIMFFTWISVWSKGIGSLFVIACKQKIVLFRSSSIIYCWTQIWDFIRKILTKLVLMSVLQIDAGSGILSKSPHKSSVFLSRSNTSFQYNFIDKHAVEPKNHKRFLFMPHTIRILCFVFDWCQKICWIITPNRK